MNLVRALCEGFAKKFPLECFPQQHVIKRILQENLGSGHNWTLFETLVLLPLRNA